MPLSAFDAITKLPREFSPDTQTCESPLLVTPSLRLRDPLDGFLMELRWNRDHHLSAPLEIDDATLRRAMRECHHYMSNICVLLWFFHDYLERCRRVSAHRRNRSRLARLVATLPARSRPIRHFTNYLSRWSRRDEFLLDAQSYLLPIQVDKLLGDVRSFLSSIYQVAQVFTPPGYLVKVPKNERFRESFGPFADRYEEGKLPPLVWPLTLLEELVPWGQTVRSLRDNYVHHGKSSIAMPRFEVPKGAAQVYFDLHGFSKRPGQRDLPDALYATDNPNDLLDLELLVLYIVVPVFALRHALGEPLQEHHSRGLSGWKPMGGSPLAGGGGISALGVMLQRRLEVVDTELYRFRRPKPAPKVK